MRWGSGRRRRGPRSAQRDSSLLSHRCGPSPVPFPHPTPHPTLSSTGSGDFFLSQGRNSHVSCWSNRSLKWRPNLDAPLSTPSVVAAALVISSCVARSDEQKGTNEDGGANRVHPGTAQHSMPSTARHGTAQHSTARNPAPTRFFSDKCGGRLYLLRSSASRLPAGLKCN